MAKKNMIKNEGAVDFQVDATLREPIVGLVLSLDNFEIKMPNGVRDRILSHMESMKEKREDWPGYMYKELEKRMRFTGKSLNAETARINDTLVRIGEKFVLLCGFDATPEQKTIGEALSEIKEDPR